MSWSAHSWQARSEGAFIEFVSVALMLCLLLLPGFLDNASTPVCAIQLTDPVSCSLAPSRNGSSQNSLTPKKMFTCTRLSELMATDALISNTRLTDPEAFADFNHERCGAV